MRKRLYLLSVLLLMVCGQTWAEKITLTAADFTVTPDGDWMYDKTEKRVNVELSPEYIMPSADVITIYYNNDKMVKPINPGTYQVYIDIEETDFYAAITGITSDAWKFDITDPLPETKEAAIAAIREEINDAEQAIENAAVGFEDVGDEKNAKANAASALADAQVTADNTIGAAADMIAIANAKDNAINAIHMATNEALVAIQAAIAGYKERMKNNINDIAMNAKNTIHEYAVADQVKETAINEIDNAVAEAEASINNADSEDDVKKAINDAQNKINQQLAYVQNYYNQLQDVLAAINKAVVDAEAAINEAADGYDFVEAIQEIITGAKADFEAVKSEASNIISKKNNLNEVKEKEEEFIHEIEDIQVEAVENIQTEIQPYTSLKENAIAEINAAIDGFTDTEVRAIADKAKTDISNATSEEQINSIKTFAISKIDAIAEILSASQGIKNAELNAWIDAAINDIKSGNQNATPSIDEIKEQILYIINLFQNGKAEGLEEGITQGKAAAFGTMGEKQNGPAIIVTGKDDNEIILYSPKSVEYIKVNEE